MEGERRGCAAAQKGVLWSPEPAELFHMRQGMTHAHEKGKEDFFLKKYIAVKLV